MKKNYYSDGRKKGLSILFFSLFFTLFCANAQDYIYLSDMEWVSATAGWNTVKKDANVVGDPLKVYDIIYPKGFGTHGSDDLAGMDIVYDIEGLGYDFVEAFAGIHDQNSINQARFTMLVDGVVKASVIAGGTQQAKRMSTDIRGGKTLILRINSMIEEPSIYARPMDFDVANWCSVLLIKDNGYACNMPFINEKSETDYLAKRYNTAWNNPVTIAGVSYPQSIGTRANSEIELDIRGKNYKSFTSLVGGVDYSFATAGNKINFVAIVLDDCKNELRRAEINTEQTLAAVELKLDVTGGSYVILKTLDGGDGIAGDGGAWANPLFSIAELPTSNPSPAAKSNIKISTFNENLVIYSADNKIISVAIYDVQGKLLNLKTNINQSNYTQKIPQKNTTYLLKITTKNETVSKIVSF